VTRAIVHRAGSFFFLRRDTREERGAAFSAALAKGRQAPTGRAKQIDKQNHVCRKIVLLSAKGREKNIFRSNQWRSLRYLDEYGARG